MKGCDMPLSKADDATLRKLLHAAGVLNVHGMVTDYERRVIHSRMVKWKARKVGKPSPKRGRK